MGERFINQGYECPICGTVWEEHESLGCPACHWTGDVYIVDLPEPEYIDDWTILYPR